MVHQHDVNERLIKSKIVFFHETSTEFAKVIGKNKSYVCHVLKGRHRLKPEDQLLWSKLLDTPISDLFPNGERSDS